MHPPHQPLHTDFPSELKTELRLVDKQRRDLSGCQGIIFHFIISSAVGSVDVSVDRLRYITRARCHPTQGGMRYPLQGRVAWMAGTSGAEADLGPGGGDAITDRHLRPQLVIKGRVITAHVTSQCVTTRV